MRQLIVGFADVPTAHDAVSEAVTLAEELGASVHVVMATDEDSRNTVRIGSDAWNVGEVEQAEAAIRNFMTTLGSSVEYTVGVAAGSPGDVLVAEAAGAGQGPVGR